LGIIKRITPAKGRRPDLPAKYQRHNITSLGEFGLLTGKSSFKESIF